MTLLDKVLRNKLVGKVCDASEVVESVFVKDRGFWTYVVAPLVLLGCFYSTTLPVDKSDNSLVLPANQYVDVNGNIKTSTRPGDCPL